MPIRIFIAAVLSFSCSIPAHTQDELEKSIPPISVREGDWGGAAPVDIAAVAKSAAAELCKVIEGTEFLDPIEVYKRSEGPITLYDRKQRGQYQVGIAINGTYWSQCAFQFSHEFCHILSRYDTKREYQWFEETLCELASLYTLRQMAETWKTNPPYSHWSSYSQSLADYAQDRIEQSKLDDEVVLADFVAENLERLNQDGTIRELNTSIAIGLLDLFEDEPEHWAALPYLNFLRDGKEPSFGHYLAGWQMRAPLKHKEFIRKLAGRLGVELP